MTATIVGIILIVWIAPQVLWFIQALNHEMSSHTDETEE